MNLNEMSLPAIDINSPEFMRDPHAKYAEARSQSWIAAFADGYVLNQVTVQPVHGQEEAIEDWALVFQSI